MNRVAVKQPPPMGFTQDQTRAAFNNAMAQAHAQSDPRYAMKAGNYDRSGLSRGGMQFSQAGADSGRKLAEGIASAYQGQLADADYNAKTALQGLVEQEQFAQQLGSLQAQNAYANQMAALQQRQMGMNLLGGLVG